jgi:MFS transporter, NNP family, nitrate/nitrite transporter
MRSQALTDWDPENSAFWQSQGSRTASRNLLISIPSLMLAFAVWMVWSVVVVNLPNVGFTFSTSELFWLAALPSLCGGTLRILYPFVLPVFGGRRWTAISTASLLLPALGIGICVQDPATSYSTFVVLALLCGFGGGNFASSMANINFFFPIARKGIALGLNAGLGNLGVSLAQFIVPAVITGNLFGILGGDPQASIRASENGQVWLQNAGFIWVPLIAILAVTAWFGMDDIVPTQVSLSDQATVLGRRHSWIMAWLYLGTFGSFIGYSAGFPLLIKSQFPLMDALSYAWLGPLVGALTRPVGGWLADKYGGARVTLWNFVAMAAGVLGVLAFLPQNGEGGNFHVFLAMFLVLFVTAGIGNGSTFRMIPILFVGKRLHMAAGNGRAAAERAVREANAESAGAFGLASAIGAYGGFFIPMSYGASIPMTGGVKAALWVFLMFYATCIGMTWWNYARRDAPSPC